MLNIDLTVKGNEAKIILKGKLNAASSDELSARLAEIPEEVMKIEMDITDLAATSSAGLRVILHLRNQMYKRGGSLLILHPNELIMDTFRDTGLADMLNIVA